MQEYSVSGKSGWVICDKIQCLSSVLLNPHTVHIVNRAVTVCVITSECLITEYQLCAVTQFRDFERVTCFQRASAAPSFRQNHPLVAQNKSPMTAPSQPSNNAPAFTFFPLLN